jgi:hypothetical protein
MPHPSCSSKLRQESAVTAEIFLGAAIKDKGYSRPTLTLV